MYTSIFSIWHSLTTCSAEKNLFFRIHFSVSVDYIRMYFNDRCNHRYQRTSCRNRIITPTDNECKKIDSRFLNDVFFSFPFYAIKKLSEAHCFNFFFGVSTQTRAQRLTLWNKSSCLKKIALKLLWMGKRLFRPWFKQNRQILSALIIDLTGFFYFFLTTFRIAIIKLKLPLIIYLSI